MFILFTTVRFKPRTAYESKRRIIFFCIEIDHRGHGDFPLGDQSPIFGATSMTNISSFILYKCKIKLDTPGLGRKKLMATIGIRIKRGKCRYKTPEYTMGHRIHDQRLYKRGRHKHCCPFLTELVQVRLPGLGRTART